MRYTLLAVCLALFPLSADALDLSGIVVYAADAEGNRIGPAWHSSSGLRAGPLALSPWNPGGARNFGLSNDTRGELDVPLFPTTHVLTLFFQADEPLPPHLVLNLYFDGDKSDPKISLLVPHRRGFMHGRLNPSGLTSSLYLEEVPNLADLVYVSQPLQARIGAAFYFPSSGVDTHQWFPGDLYLLDRVGARDYEPDGEWDSILVAELDVSPAPPPTPARRLEPMRPRRAVPPAWVLTERTLPPTIAVPTVDLEPPTPSHPPAAETPGTRTPSKTATRTGTTTPSAATPTPVATVSPPPQGEEG